MVLMIVYNQIQYDARVIRAAEAIADLGIKVKVISCNSDIKYKNDKFKSIVFLSKAKHQWILVHFWWQCLKYVLKYRKNISLLYVHDYYMPIIGGLYHVFTKRKWVYDAHELIFYRKKDKVSYRNKFFLCLEKMFVKSASLVVAANKERRKLMSCVYHLKKTIYILNVASVRKCKIDLSSKKNIIVYQGYLSAERGVDFFIYNHIGVNKKYILKLIGGGPQLEYYKAKVNELQLENRIVFTGQLDQKCLYEESQSSKIGIITYPLNDLNNYYCSPNKIFEYAKMKIPMIVTKQPFLVALIQKYHMGEVLDITKGENEYKEIIDKIDRNYSYYIERMDDFLNDYSADRELEKLKVAILDALE